MGWHSRGTWAALCAYCIATLVLLGWGFMRFREFSGNNPCSMTYSRPVYRKVQLSHPAAPYELLQYENGGGFALEPHPVLFIPGSLGSYKQARSIGSVAARFKSLQLFALDFKDEPTAFHGHYVLQQAMFVNEAIRAIHALYEAADVPAEPIVLVGHSFGGLAAKLSLLLTNHPADTVDLLVLLSTPVARPPFHPDSSFEEIYRTMDSVWKLSLENGVGCVNATKSNTATVKFVRCAPNVQNVTLVSISGGDMDLLVRDGITKVAGSAFNQSFSVSSHELHSVQFGIDHQAILWCNQLVTAVVQGIQSWTGLPVDQRSAQFWVDELKGAATTADLPSENGDDAKTVASVRYSRLVSSMGVVGGAVYVAAVDHLPLVLMAFTAIGFWTLARILLSQVLKLPLDLSSPLNLMIPNLSSAFHGWLFGPLLAQQILPPPLAKFLLNQSTNGSLTRWSVGAGAVAILAGVMMYYSQQGVSGLMSLLRLLPGLLAVGVAIMLWAVLAVVFSAVSRAFAPVSAIAWNILRKFTSGREGRAWRRKLERHRLTRFIIPFCWCLIAGISYFLTPRKDAGTRGVEDIALTLLCVLFYVAYRTFCVQWLGMLVWRSASTEQSGYHLLLTGLYFPVLFLAYPTSSFASRVLFDSHALPGVFQPLIFDLLMSVLCLAAVVTHLHLARHRPLKVAPVEEWHELVASWTPSESSAHALSAENSCLHEDGGELAIYELTDQPCVKLAPGVYLGPMFRVAWCDCSRNPKMPSAEYCDWCRCKRCGNKERKKVVNRSQSHDEYPTDAIMSVCVVALSMFLPWWVGEYTFRNMFASAVMATMFAILHLLPQA